MKDVVDVAVATLHRAQHVGRQPAVAGAGFDQGESNALCGCREHAGHLGDLHREQLAEQRPDVDAGKKIAGAARSLGGAGVVAVLGMVERQLHERGHGDRAAVAD